MSIKIPLLLLGATIAGHAQVDPAEFFEARVRPVLANNCYSCHTTSKLGGLELDSRASLLRGGKSGPGVVPGKPAESLLIKAVSQTDTRLKMPVGSPKLKDEEIADLSHWVKMGAPWPESKQSGAKGICPHPGKAGSLVAPTAEYTSGTCDQRCGLG